MCLWPHWWARFSERERRVCLRISFPLPQYRQNGKSPDDFVACRYGVPRARFRPECIPSNQFHTEVIIALRAWISFFFVFIPGALFVVFWLVSERLLSQCLRCPRRAFGRSHETRMTRRCWSSTAKPIVSRSSYHFRDGLVEISRSVLTTHNSHARAWTRPISGGKGERSRNRRGLTSCATPPRSRLTHSRVRWIHEGFCRGMLLKGRLCDRLERSFLFWCVFKVADVLALGQLGGYNVRKVSGSNRSRCASIHR